MLARNISRSALFQESSLKPSYLTPFGMNPSLT
nr:MAG TPA: hypothetical protein [Bacteriophage sp.]